VAYFIIERAAFAADHCLAIASQRSMCIPFSLVMMGGRTHFDKQKKLEAQARVATAHRLDVK
jgi:hypothetical protein